MAQSTARPEAAVDLQMVREFLERYFTIENEIKVLQQDKVRSATSSKPGARHEDHGSRHRDCQETAGGASLARDAGCLDQRLEEPAASPRGVTAGSAWKATRSCVIQPPLQQ